MKKKSFKTKCPGCARVFEVQSPPHEIICPYCHIEFSPYQHIKTDPKVIAGIAGFTAFMLIIPMIHAFYQFGNRQKDAENRIKAAQKATEHEQKFKEKQRKFEMKIKEMKKWKNFASKNLQPFSKHSDFSKDISKFNFKVYGAKKPEVIVYEIYHPYKYRKIKQAIKRRKRLLKKYPRLAWVYVPVTKNPSKDKTVFNLIFEITEQNKGNIDDLMKKFYIYGRNTPEHLKTIIKRIHCNEQNALKAIKTNKFRKKIRDFAKLIDLYDLSEYGLRKWMLILKSTKTNKYFKEDNERPFDYSIEEIIGLFYKYPDFRNLNTNRKFYNEEEKVKTVIIKK